MKIFQCVASLILISCAFTVSAADSTGSFMVGGGAGGVRCPEFVSVMESARTHKIGSAQYWDATGNFVMYILGFQTGYNMSTPDTYDIFSGAEDLYPQLAWIEQFCRNNSTVRFGDAVTALARDAYPNRRRIDSGE